MPSNQKQIIEQAKFTHSPLGKAFERQKTVEDQGEKRIKAIQNQGQVRTNKKYAYNNEDTLLISKQKEVFNKFAYERLELYEKVNPNDLVFRYKDPTADVKFNGFDNAPDLLNKIREGEISFRM